MLQRAFPILFLGAAAIGDAVLSSGLVRRLGEEIPNARFTIVTGAAAAPLYADLPNLDRVIVLDKTGPGDWLKLWTQVRGRKWGLVLDQRGSPLPRFLTSQRKALPRKAAGEPVHKVIEAARLLRLEDEPPTPFLFTSEETEARAEDLTAGKGPILAMGPAAGWMGKTWPLDRFARTAIELLGPEGPLAGGRLAIFGGPQDIRAVEELKKVVQRDHCIDLVGQTDILTAYACLKRARLFIGNETGLMHLAAATGTPTLGLFGPSDEQLCAPWGEHARMVRGPRSFEQIRAVDPTLSQALNHMMDLPVSAVVEAATALLAETSDA